LSGQKFGQFVSGVILDLGDHILEPLGRLHIVEFAGGQQGSWVEVSVAGKCFYV